MKSSLKLSVVFFVSISLFVVCSFLLLNAKAEVSLQKISLGSNTIRIQTDKAIPVIDVQLLENTDHCLTDCYAILRIHPYQSINLPAEANAEFAWNFAKEKPWMDGLISHHFEILETIEYKVDVPDYGRTIVNTTCYNPDNTTYQCEVEQTVQTGSHEETRYTEVYKPFAFWGGTLQADQDYIIKLVGKKRAQLGTNNVDWIPTMKGLELNDWAWWNSSYPYRYKIKSNVSVVSLPININDTNEPNYWTQNASLIYLYCQNSGCVSELVAVANETDELNWENETARAGHNPTSVWEPNLKGVWHFGEGSGTKANDSTTNGNNGTFVNTPSFNSDGKFGSALNFTRSGGDWVNVPDSVSVRLGNSMTIMAWFRTPVSEPTSGMYTIMAKEMEQYDNYNSYGLTINGPPHIRFYLSLTGATANYVACVNTTAVAPFDGNWHHIAGTYNGTAMVLYFDGAKQTICANTYGIGYTAEPLNFGKWRDGDTGYFDGDLDEIRLYNRTLTAQEIREIYWNGINNLTSLGPEESLCPSDDTFISNSTTYQPVFCNVNDGDISGVLIINASNIILDCNGMTLNGNGSGIGIEDNKFNNVSIKNCRMQNYDSGIKFDEFTENNTLLNNTLSLNIEAGINLNSSVNNNLTGNTICSNGRGIKLYNSAFKNVMYQNNISQNTYKGVYIYNSIGEGIESNNTFINNIIKSNGEHDVYLWVDEYDFFINTTYDTEDIQTGNLTRQWYLKVNVTTKNMSALGNAQVSAYDKFNNLEWTDNTSANGLTDWNIVTQYIHNQSGIFNYTPHTIQVLHPDYPANSTIQNITESKVVHVILKNWEIMFNVTSGEDETKEINDLTIDCNYTEFNQNDTTNPYGYYEFPPGIWSCTFKDIPDEKYYNTSITFTANNDTIIHVKMSEKAYLTYEEHNWIESIYNCLINKDCDVYDLWNQTYEYALNIWDQFKQTDESVVVSEQTTSSVVNATSNLTIEYVIDVPVKEDYQFLPIRIFYWFMDENNEICYSQAKESNSAEAPFCNPLVAQTIGEVNIQINFTVDLRPSLPEGNYTVIRRIDIDPENVWINYGHEAIGTLEVVENSGGPEIKLSMNGNPIKHEIQEPVIQSATEMKQSAGDKTTGMITTQQIDNVSYIAVMVSVITLILVGLMYKNSRKRTPWGS